MLNANHAALFFTVAMLAVTTYFLFGSIPLLILKHDNTMDSKFIRSFYITYFKFAIVVATAATSRRVLLPRRAVAPLLHQAVAAQGYGVEQQPAACQEAEAWIKRARDRQLALPISPELLAPSWLERHGLQPLADQPVLVEQLWLMLPQGAVNTKAARQCLRLLRVQIAKAQTMQNQPGPNFP